MKQSKRILLILHILGWSFASLLFLALDRSQQPDLVIVTGTVLDLGSMTPLPGVEVAWKSQKVTSDKTGHYEIQLPAGVREIAFSAPNRPSVRKVLIVRQPGYVQLAGVAVLEVVGLQDRAMQCVADHQGRRRLECLAVRVLVLIPVVQL